MFAFEQLRMLNRKYSFHIIHPVLTVFMGLARCVALSYQIIGHHGFAQYRGHGFAEQFALVVATLKLTSWMQRDGDKTIDVTETVGSNQLFG